MLWGRNPRIEPVTQGPKHHWFGYYDKCPWDASGRLMLAMESEFCDRAPKPGDVARVGVVDTKKRGQFTPVGETTAWNWQLGARPQWLNTPGGHELVYNTREGGHFVAVVRNLQTGSSRTLPQPVFAVSEDGSYALTLNYSRLADCLPGHGYPGVLDPNGEESAPENDGIWRMDLRTGESRLVVTLAQLAAHEQATSMDGAKHWVNNLQPNPDDTRFAFLHRWSSPPYRVRQHRMLTAKLDGSDLRVVCDYQLVSHYGWYGSEEVVAWARQMDMGDKFYQFNVLTGRREVVGSGTLDEDGHCTYSPNRRWLVTDTLPDEENKCTLTLYRPEDDYRVDVGRFFADPRFEGECRCDLHPRWSRDGKRICFDSLHEGTRQMYVVDVGRIVA